MKYLLFVWLFTFSFGFACAQNYSLKKQEPKVGNSDSEIVVVDIVGEGKEFDGTLYVVEQKYYLAESMMHVFGKLGINKNKDIESMRVSTNLDHFKTKNKKVIDKLPPKYLAKLKGMVTIILKPKAME